MNIQTNFDEAAKEKLKSLVGNKLRELIFYQPNPNRTFHFSSTFPSRDRFFSCRVAQLALAFEMPPIMEGKRRRRVTEVVSIESNNHDRDNRIIDNYWGGLIWNLDFHFDSENHEGVVVTKIGETDLFKVEGRRKLRLNIPHVKMEGGKQIVEKIEVFGMTECFDDVNEYGFTRVSVDIRIVTIVVLSLSDNSYIVINGRNGLSVRFLNEEEMQKQYEFMRERKNTFERPIHTLMYSIEAPS